jgi:hypothetical protein
MISVVMAVSRQCLSDVSCSSPRVFAVAKAVIVIALTDFNICQSIFCDLGRLLCKGLFSIFWYEPRRTGAAAPSCASGPVETRGPFPG